MQNALAKKFNFKSLMKFTLPSTIMMLFFSLYSLVDGMFISRFVGTDALAGLNIIYPVINTIVAITIMISSGGSAVIAKYMGEKQDKKAKEIFSMLILIGLIIGAVLMAVSIIYVEEIAWLLGATDDTILYAIDYGKTLGYFTLLAILQMFYQTFFVTAGKPGLGLFLGVLSGITNIVMDYVLIMPLNLGVKGAAIATGLGYAIPAVYGTFYFMFNKKSSLKFTVPRIKIRELIKVFTNGSSEMVVNLAMAITTMMFNIIMSNMLGADGVAAVTIIQYMQFTLTAIFMGYSSGVAPVVSYKYGARDYDQQKVILKVSLLFIGAVSIITFILSEALSSYMILIFTERESPVFDIAQFGFYIFSISYLFTGFNIFASSYFTAFSNGKVSAFLSFMITLVIIAICLIVLPKILGVLGVWLAVPVAELLTLALTIICLIGYGKKYGYSLMKKDKRYKAKPYVRVEHNEYIETSRNDVGVVTSIETEIYKGINEK